MRTRSALQVLLLSIFVLLLAAGAGAQSTQGEAGPSANTSSNSPASTEQQEMRDELKALRAEVERLRAEVEHGSNAVPANIRSEAMPAAAPEKSGAGPKCSWRDDSGEHSRPPTPLALFR